MRVLLAKLNHIGDMLMLTPTLRFLRERYPEAEIDVMVRGGTESVLLDNHDISRLVVTGSLDRPEFSINALAAETWSALKSVGLKRYDYAFDLSNSDRAKLWMHLTRSEVLASNNAYGELGRKSWLVNRQAKFKWGLDHQVLKDFKTVTDIMELSGDPGPLIINTNSAKRRIDAWLEQAGVQSSYVIIHTVSRWPTKQWLQDRWLEVAKSLKREFGLSVVFSCGPSEIEVKQANYLANSSGENTVSTQGELTLVELGELIRRATIFAGVDTAVMHIAAAVQTPTVALFGPSSEWSWKPWQCRHELVLGQCSCKKTRKFICDKTKPYPCMQQIQVAEVLDAVNLLMEDN